MQGLLILLVSAAAVAAFVWGAVASLQAHRWAVGARVARLAAGGNPAPPSLAPTATPFGRRFVTPTFTALAAAVGRLLPRDAVRRVEARLALAGHPWRTSAVDFIGVQVLAGAVLGALGLWFAVASHGGPGLAILLVAVMAVLGAYMPRFLVSSRIAARRRLAVEALPDAVDLLVVCVEAGLGFDAALLKLVEKTHGPIAEEISADFAETRMGRSRRDALQGIASRLDVPEVGAFISAVLQSDRLGVPIADVLRAQSEFLRQLRRQRVEEASMRVPVKMIFPMVFCILPALMLVILGPALIQVARSLGALH